jgi:hypothetical protein
MNFQVLEEVYQEYKDRVNFIWVYGREAHPESEPFPPGVETRDLGWDHRYYGTSTMEQRAQRARWMKSDLAPNAEIPMLIDYVSSDLGPDDSIREAYIGAGFYSAFVIDCDATILFESAWGWHEPGGQWWGLPMPTAESLRQFLDDYLADPPACYDPSPSMPAEDLLFGTSEDILADDGPPTVLVVDDDAGEAYESYYTMPIANLKKVYDLWHVELQGSPQLADLLNYEVVVWLTGDAATDTLTPEDQDHLGAYLDAGGGLILSGQNIGRDIGDTAFFANYLHASYLGDGPSLPMVVGEDLLVGRDLTLQGVDGESNQVSPSRLVPLAGAIRMGTYDDQGATYGAAVRWEGDYRVAYLGFGLEGVGVRGASARRFDVLKRLFSWMQPVCPGNLDWDPDIDADDFGLFAETLVGPNVSTPPIRVDRTQFLEADLDDDGDVDIWDAAFYFRTFSEDCD